MKNRLLLYVLFCVMANTVVTGANIQNTPRERISLNTGWCYRKSDPVGVDTSLLHYSRLKHYLLPCANDFIKTGKKHIRPQGNPGADNAYVKVDFDDSNWRKLDLPHDWAIEEPFNIDYEGSTGKLPYWGIRWYRKSFELDKADAGRQIYLDIDGAMSYSSVWCNGNFVGGWPYGYASYRLDLTKYVKPGEKNTLAIRLDNPNNSSRWYPGAGIYRNVWLVKTSAVHIDQWGTFIRNGNIEDGQAEMLMDVSLVNRSTSPVEGIVSTDIYMGDSLGNLKGNKLVSVKNDGVKVAKNDSKKISYTFVVKSPKLWNTETPNLYVAVTRIVLDGKEVDRYTTTFGIRKIEFTPDKGLLLNGKKIPIKGVCLHHDLGALGAAFNEKAAERQLCIMKEMGVNAIRTSHNPPAPELVSLCDRMGLLMQLELSDAWLRGKLKNDYSVLFEDWHEADMRSLVRHYRNNPSVIMWSIGNEVPDQTTDDGIKIAADLTSFCHDEDPTRPTSLGSNRPRAFTREIVNSVDIWGLNYQVGQYAKFRETNPGKMLHGSETSSATSSRNEYFFPVTKKRENNNIDFQVSSYDMVTVPWGCPPENQFKVNEENPASYGEFVWTGFDYLGEPTPYNKDITNILNFNNANEREKAQKELEQLGKIKPPSRSSYFGIVDLCGFPKDRYYCYKSYWRPDIPTLHILPHWNWPNRRGEITPVHIYTSGDEVELFLNGKSQGKKEKKKSYDRLVWENISYGPGTLKAVAYKNGKKWAEQSVKTTGTASQIAIEPEKNILLNNGCDLSFVRVAIQDKEGLVVPDSKNHLKFSVSGPADIVATDNGDATNLVSFQSLERDAYNGLCLVILRSQRGKTGEVILTVESPGLSTKKMKINVIGETEK